MTVERKVIALAVATVLIPAATFVGVVLRWPDGAPSSVSYPLAVGILGMGIAGFRLQARLWPSADRLFVQTFLWTLLVVAVPLVGAAAIREGKIVGDDWINVVLQSGLAGLLIWLAVRSARDSDATTRKPYPPTPATPEHGVQPAPNTPPISGQHPPPRRARDRQILPADLWFQAAGRSTIERRPVAVAVAMVLVAIGLCLGVWLRWPDGDAPSYVIPAVAVGIIVLGLTGFLLQQCLSSPADRLFSRTVGWIFYSIMLVVAVASVVMKISRGDWIAAVFQCGFLGWWIWVMVLFVRARTQPSASPAQTAGEC
ncbi:MAG: hypothetical protein WKF96_23710 [Solirubrobacteraceae bacterium]